MSKKLYNTNDPRVIRTHKQINEAFIKLLKTKALDEFSVTDIAKEAQVNRSTFYSHYYDKYDVLEEVVNDTFMKYLKNEPKENTPKFSIKTLETLIFSTKAYYIDIKSKCKQGHINLIPLAEKVILQICKEFLIPYMNDAYFHKLTENQKEMWICTICYSIIGITSEYAENLNYDMVHDEIQFLFSLVS